MKGQTVDVKRKKDAHRPTTDDMATAPIPAPTPSLTTHTHICMHFLQSSPFKHNPA